MGKNFLKFRRKVRTEAILSALFIGLGAGLISYAAAAIVYKLSGRALPLFYYAIFGGGALLVSLILYFIFTPSDKRLAKRLDSLYSLDEKVSTMVEFKDSDDGFAVLQREDAEEKLAEQSIRAVKSTRLIASILVLFIAVGSLVGSLFVPMKVDTETPIDEFDKQWIITAINELITIVESAYIDDTLKASAVTELKSLLDFVEGSQLLSEMKTEAVKTVIAIKQALDNANSAEAIAEQFAASQDENIKNLGNQMSELSGSGAKKALVSLGEALSDVSADDVLFACDEINTYLQSSGVRSDDAVYMMFKTLIATVKADPSKVENECESASNILSAAVIIQNVNKSTISVVINKLCNLFGITEDDLTAVDPDTDIDIGAPSDKNPIPDDPTVEEPDVGIGSGGIGTGDVIYGSNDMIYDPHTKSYRPYGEVINEYFAKANEYMTDGKTSQEISDALEEYFGILFGGAE